MSLSASDLIQPPADNQAYLEWLRQPTGGNYTLVVPLGADRWVGIQRLLFHWTMHVGRMDDRTGHDDRYCYATFDGAVTALNDWIANDFEGEPAGWHRHPPTGRRRPEGNKEGEYVDP